jgi:hypothetical protein
MPVTTTPTAPVFDSTYIQNWIAGMLGDSGRSVELEPSDYKFCIDDSMRRLNVVIKKRSYQIKERVTTSTLETLEAFEVQLDADVVDVIDMHFLNEQHLLFTQDVFAIDRYRRDYRGGTIDITLTKMFNETYLRQRGAMPDWEFDTSLKKLHVFAPAGPYKMGITIAKNFVDPAEIPPDYQSIFLKIGLRYAKERLGRIRGKYGNSLPGTTGETVFDGAELLAEAASMESELVEELKALRDNPGVVFG